MLPSVNFQNGAQIQDGRQKACIDLTCEFYYFFKFIQDCLNLVNCSFLRKSFFHKNSKWLKISIWEIFCTKIHDFLVPLNEMF
jgi:hypothetical protein